MIENYRFPSYPNVRYAALNEDEYPIAGALYTEYTFTYCANRIGFGGMSGVGQEVSAVTKHVLFVENSLVDDFEKVIKDAGIDIVGPGTPAGDDKKIVIINAASISKAQGSVQLTADESPVKKNAHFTWAVVSGPATVSTGGVLTLSEDANVDDVIVVKASLEGYSDGTIEIKVIA